MSKKNEKIVKMNQDKELKDIKTSSKQPKDIFDEFYSFKDTLYIDLDLLFPLHILESGFVRIVKRLYNNFTEMELASLEKSKNPVINSQEELTNVTNTIRDYFYDKDIFNTLFNFVYNHNDIKHIKFVAFRNTMLYTKIVSLFRGEYIEDLNYKNDEDTVRNFSNSLTNFIYAVDPAFNNLRNLHECDFKIICFKDPFMFLHYLFLNNLTNGYNDGIKDTKQAFISKKNFLNDGYTVNRKELLYDEYKNQDDLKSENLYSRVLICSDFGFSFYKHSKIFPSFKSYDVEGKMNDLGSNKLNTESLLWGVEE